MIAFTLLTNTVSATSGLNSSETTLIEHLSNFSYKYNGKLFNLEEDLLTKVKNYLIKDNVELNDDQVNEVTKLVDEALVNLIKNNALNGSHLTNEQAKSFINDYIIPIANILNLEVSYDEDNLNITIKDENGQIIYSDSTIEDDTQSGGNDGTESGGNDGTESGGNDGTESGGNDGTESGGNDDTQSGSNDDTQSGGNDDTVTDNNNETLPQTGDSVSSTVFSMLSSLMVVGGLLLNKKKIK